MCILFVFNMVRNAVCAHLYVSPISASMRDTYMYPDVELTVFKIVSYENLIMLGISF